MTNHFKQLDLGVFVAHGRKASGQNLDSKSSR